ncbi:unnamed protein product [Acanthoscelides obtectus]|uniref:Uncharacterized protein n=1 Tax=Acanthoscelides obtectus TaxID=200917 RepID=A0A9P0LUP2_ACAOB|nr:unnamed protein product [Acanthoscelides obtectus]CAK1654440.1 hypothetical protein AOBTE_LOCUS18596 [Acanthoscelides obtectus]
MGDTRTLAREHVCMQHAHILAPPTRTAGWYLRVRQSETIYHLRTITTSMAKRNIHGEGEIRTRGPAGRLISSTTL